MQYIEYICLGLCSLHFLVEFLFSLFQGRRISKLCNKCHMPVIDNSAHYCAPLNESQLNKLVDFVKDLRGDNNG